MKHLTNATKEAVAYFANHAAWGNKGHHCRRRHDKRKHGVAGPTVSAVRKQGTEQCLFSLGPQSMGWWYQYSGSIFPPQLDVCKILKNTPRCLFYESTPNQVDNSPHTSLLLISTREYSALWNLTMSKLLRVPTSCSVQVYYFSIYKTWYSFDISESQKKQSNSTLKIYPKVTDTQRFMYMDVHYGISPNYNDYDSNKKNNDLIWCPLFKYHESNFSTLSHVIPTSSSHRGAYNLKPREAKVMSKVK